MAFRYSPYAAIFAITAITSALLAIYVWKKRTIPGGIYFTLLMAAVTEWALMDLIESSIIETPIVIACAKLAYIGIVSVPVLWFLFTLAYDRRSPRLNDRWIWLLWVIPLATLGLVITNEWHGLVWPGITSAPGEAAPIFEHGVWFWINVIYSYILILASTLLLLRIYLRSSKAYSSQIWILMLGAVFPWIGNVLYITQLNVISGLDLTPIAFTCTGVVCAWGFFTYQLFDLVPIARDMMFISMSDGVLVIDGRGRIADINPAAQRMTGATDAVIGHGADAVLAKWPDLVECCIEKKETQMEILLNDLRNGRWLETRISLLYTSERQPPGLLIILHDITELKRNEETLKRFNESLQAEIKEREKAEETIKASLHEKEVLLKEIHHRVKNNLQIISSLLSLQSGTGQGGPEAFRESQNRIKSMALIHEKLYRSENLSHVDFSEYVASLTGYLTKSYILRPNVALQIDIQDISLDVDTAIPCGLIINELVSNTLKYAFRDGMAGTIRVSMDRDKGGYVLKVGDNGSGLPKGLDFRNSPSLGLQLVNTLVDQIGGTIELEPGSGTTFVITFAGPRTGEKTSFAKPPPGEARER